MIVVVVKKRGVSPSVKAQKTKWLAQYAFIKFRNHNK